MGCGASAGSAKNKERLCQIEAYFDENARATGDDNLDEVAAHAKVLVQVFQDIVASGKNLQEQLAPCEQLSSKILGNLESRINADLFKRSDFDDVEKRIMAIGEDLDKCRATKATTVLEQSFKPGKEAKEKETLKYVAQVAAIVAKVQTPELVVPGVNGVLKKLEEAMASTSTGGEKVANAMLDQCSQLADKISEFGAAKMSAAPVDLKGFKAYQAAAKKLDEAALDIARIPGAKSWAELAPKLDTIIETKADHVCKAVIDSAEAHLEKEEGAKAYQKLLALQPWWPYCKNLPDGPKRLSNCFELAEKQATTAFRTALENSDEGMINGILEFATSLDTVRSGFAGLSAPSGSGLLTTLRALQSGDAALSPLGDLEAELNKEGGQNLMIMITSIEALAASFPSPPGDEHAELVAQTGEACSKLEAWILKAAAACEAEKLGPLATLTKRYDQAKTKLAQGDGAPLQPRLVPHACGACLARAEEELAKESGSNPNEVVEAIKALGERVPEAGLNDECKSRLEAIVAQNVGRVTEAFSKAVEEGADAKVEALQRYAVMFDNAVATTGLVDCDLQGQLKAMEPPEAPARDTAPAADPASLAEVNQRLDSLEAELAKETGRNPNTQLKLLEELSGLWEPVANTAEEPHLRSRLSDAFGQIKTRMVEANAAAAAEDDTKKIQLLVQFAHKFDEAQAGLGDACPGLLVSVVRAGADADLRDAETELNKESHMDPRIILKSLSNLKIYWPLLGEDAEAEQLQARLGDVVNRVGRRMTAKYSEAADDEKRKAGLLAFAGQLDIAIDGLAGAGPPELKSRLEALG